MKPNIARVIVEKRAIRREAVTFKLPYPPSVNCLYSNIPGTGRIKTRSYKAWLIEAGYTIRIAGTPRVNGPVELSYIFQDKPGVRDLGNIEKATTDLLVSMGCIDADDSKTVRKITLEWGSEKGVIVTITPAPGEKWLTRKGLAELRK